MRPCWQAAALNALLHCVLPGTKTVATSLVPGGGEDGLGLLSWPVADLYQL